MFVGRSASVILLDGFAIMIVIRGKLRAGTSNLARASISHRTLLGKYAPFN